jgi:hypothetical protein
VRAYAGRAVITAMRNASNSVELLGAGRHQTYADIFDACRTPLCDEGPMHAHRFPAVLTIVNFILLASMLGARSRSLGAAQGSDVLRAHGLEIVDEHNRVRASITVQPATTVAGIRYPETVLLRLIDPASGPVVKLTAAANGSALGLSDDANGGVQLFARDTGSFVRVTNKGGHVQTIGP